MENSKKIINEFLTKTHNANTIKDTLFKAAEAALNEGWTYMETAFQLGGKAKETGLLESDAEAIIRRAFASEKRVKERSTDHKPSGGRRRG